MVTKDNAYQYLGFPKPPTTAISCHQCPTMKDNGGLLSTVLACTETVNFENQPRIRSMLQMATIARKENRPVKVSGVVKGGRLDIEYFEGVRTDTAWHKNKNPYYSYAAYYEWSPFAYSPNVRVLKE